MVHRVQQHSINCCHLRSFSVSVSDHPSPTTNYQLARGISTGHVKGLPRILTLVLLISGLSFFLSFLTCIAREIKCLLEETRAAVLNSGCRPISYRAVNKLQMPRCLLLKAWRAAHPVRPRTPLWGPCQTSSGQGPPTTVLSNPGKLWASPCSYNALHALSELAHPQRNQSCLDAPSPAQCFLLPPGPLSVSCICLWLKHLPLLLYKCIEWEECRMCVFPLMWITLSNRLTPKLSSISEINLWEVNWAERRWSPVCISPGRFPLIGQKPFSLRQFTVSSYQRHAPPPPPNCNSLGYSLFPWEESMPHWGPCLLTA